MADEINIELTPEAERILGYVREMPQTMLVDIAKGMGRGNALLISHIQETHLTGQGPFPVEEHKLGVRTGRLRGALFAGDVTISANSVESSIGDSAKYAAVHEFGWTIHHKARTGTARLRTDAQGNLVRQAGYPHLAVFAKGSHKRAKEVAYEAGEHDVIMPERAPVRTGIREKLQEYGMMISEAIAESWNKGRAS